MVLCNQSHCVFFFGYTSLLCIQRLLCGLPLNPDKYFFLFQYRIEGFHAGIIVWISLTAKGMQDFFPAQAIFKRLACILASKVTMQNDSFCIPDVQAGMWKRSPMRNSSHGLMPMSTCMSISAVLQRSLCRITARQRSSITAAGKTRGSTPFTTRWLGAMARRSFPPASGRRRISPMPRALRETSPHGSLPPCVRGSSSQSRN